LKNNDVALLARYVQYTYTEQTNQSGQQVNNDE